MSLPAYDKSKRKKTFEQLPKGAYVIKILGAKQEPNKSGSGEHIKMIIDIAEGEYKDYFKRIYDGNTNEDARWPNDGTFYLNIPFDGCKEYIWSNYNTFFANLEDSNSEFVFDGSSLTYLKGKLIGGKFNHEQTEYNGRIYDHTKLKWTCVADDVRNGKPGKMPPDKLLSSSGSATATDEDGFMEVPDGLDLDELPFR